MGAADAPATFATVHTGLNRGGRARLLATELPNDGSYAGVPRYDAANAYELVYNELGVFYQTVSSVQLEPGVGSTILILFGRSEWNHFGGHYLLFENRSDRSLIRNLNTIAVPGWSAGTTWNNFSTSMVAVHAARGLEVRVSARDAIMPIWNSNIDEQLLAAGGRAERAANPRFEWRAFANADGTRAFDPPGNEHFLVVGQRLLLHGPGVIPDYDATLEYVIKLVPAPGGISGWVQSWSWWVDDGLYHDYMAALVQPYVALGAERVNDVLANFPLPLPPGIQVSDLYYLPGNQADPLDEGRRRIRTGRAYVDATIVLELT